MTPRKITPELIGILDGREMGRVTRDNRARLTATYNEDWRTAYRFVSAYLRYFQVLTVTRSNRTVTNSISTPSFVYSQNTT